MCVQVIGDLSEKYIHEASSKFKNYLNTHQKLVFFLKITEMHFKYLLNEFAYLYQ